MGRCRLRGIPLRDRGWSHRVEQGSAQAAARCPRCGYDQRGFVSTWSEQCPLEGVCAECGLSIQWAELLSEKLQRPQWCVEYARSFRDGLRRSIASLGMVFVPWVLWRSLKMTHPPRIRKLVVIPMLAVALMMGMWYGAARTNASVSEYNMYIRGWGATMNVGIVKVCVQSVLMPWSKASPGTYTVPARVTVTPKNPAPTTPTTTTRPFPPPAAYSVYPSTAICGLWWRRGHGIEPPLVFGPIVSTTLFALMFPLGFLALPITRKNARVRWIHVGRVMLYSMGWMFLFALLVLICTIVEPLDIAWTSTAVSITHILGYLGTPLFLIVFWQAAVRRY